jgi:hypothetical protein
MAVSKRKAPPPLEARSFSHYRVTTSSSRALEVPTDTDDVTVVMVSYGGEDGKIGGDEGLSGDADFSGGDGRRGGHDDGDVINKEGLCRGAPMSCSGQQPTVCPLGGTVPEQDVTFHRGDV